MITTEIKEVLDRCNWCLTGSVALFGEGRDIDIAVSTRMPHGLTMNLKNLGFEVTKQFPDPKVLSWGGKVSHILNYGLIEITILSSDNDLDALRKATNVIKEIVDAGGWDYMKKKSNRILHFKALAALFRKGGADVLFSEIQDS